MAEYTVPKLAEQTVPETAEQTVPETAHKTARKLVVPNYDPSRAEKLRKSLEHDMKTLTLEEYAAKHPETKRWIEIGESLGPYDHDEVMEYIMDNM